MRKLVWALVMAWSTLSAMEAQPDIIEANSGNLDALLTKHPNVVLEVYSPDCEHCRIFAPTFEAVAKKFKGKYVFVKFNGSVKSDWLNKLQISVFPTTIIFRQGVLHRRYDGVMSEEKLSDILS